MCPVCPVLVTDELLWFVLPRLANSESGTGASNFLRAPPPPTPVCARDSGRGRGWLVRLGREDAGRRAQPLARPADRLAHRHRQRGRRRRDARGRDAGAAAEHLRGRARRILGALGRARDEPAHDVVALAHLDAGAAARRTGCPSSRATATGGSAPISTNARVVRVALLRAVAERERDGVRLEREHLRAELGLDAALGGVRLDRLLVLRRGAVEALAAVRDHHLRAGVGERERGLARGVTTADDEHRATAPLVGILEQAEHLRQVLARDLQRARLAARADRQHDALRAIARRPWCGCRTRRRAPRATLSTDSPWLHVHADALDQLAPDRDQLLLRRVEHRQQRQVQRVVGLGHHELALGVARDRRRDHLLLLEHDVRQAALDARQRRRQPARARADDRDVDGRLAAPERARPQPGREHVLDHRAPEVRGVLDQRLAGDLADQVLAGDRGLEVLVDLGDLERRRRRRPRGTSRAPRSGTRTCTPRTGCSPRTGARGSCSRPGRGRWSGTPPRTHRSRCSGRR